MWILNRSLFQSKFPHADEQKQPTSIKEEEIKELAEKLWEIGKEEKITKLAERLWKAGGCLQGLEDYYRNKAQQELETYYRNQARKALQADSQKQAKKKFNTRNRVQGLLQSLYNFSSFRIIWERICPPKDVNGKQQASTFVLWILGIHFAAFGIASGRYENRKDALETRITVVATQLATISRKAALNRLSAIQEIEIPTAPKILRIWSPYTSLLGKQKKDEDIIDQIQELIISEKEDLKEVNLNGIDLSARLIDNTYFKNVDLSSANLSGASLIYADLSSTNLSSANLSSANLSSAMLGLAKLPSANLSSANLIGANLSVANLSYADLSSANLIDANLYGADLIGANLSYADLSYADLRGGFSSANLSGANLSSANFSGANLIGANLIGANLERADLKSEEVTGVGVSINRYRGGYYYVNIIYKDTPASEQDIEQGDRIIEINGKWIGKWSTLEKFEINKLLFDKEGTEVTLTIQRYSRRKDYVLVSDRFNMSQGLTPEQVKKAKNWEKACYDLDFREQLGLPREQTEECKDN